MAELTLNEIHAVCNAVITRTHTYQPLQWIAFKTLQATGCREGEVCDLTRWKLTKVGTYELQPEKGSKVRKFEAVDLPMEFREWIAGRKNGRAPTSVDRLRSSFRQMCPYGSLKSGKKGISTHLYRYAFMREMEKNGRTLEEIKEIMGLTSTKVARGYLTNPVIGE